jgi:ribosomal protein S18 acetylase RimI-like enzyme
MTPDEASAVGALAVAAYSGDFSLTDEYLAEIGAVDDRANRHEVWVAVDRTTGELLGTVSTPRPGLSISPLAREGELDFRFLGVSHLARGRGVGELMVRHVLALGTARGAHRVVLNTGPDMIAAQRLYDRLGFTRLHDREYIVTRSDGTTFPILAYGLDLEPAPE